jgi:hypothetical protein
MQMLLFIYSNFKDPFLHYHLKVVQNLNNPFAPFLSCSRLMLKFLLNKKYFGIVLHCIFSIDETDALRVNTQNAGLVNGITKLNLSVIHL